MTEKQIELMQEASTLATSTDPAAHAALREKVLAAALTSDEAVEKSAALATAVRDAKDPLVNADAVRERALFRVWMGIQVKAEQGEMFTPGPAWSIEKGE